MNRPLGNNSISPGALGTYYALSNALSTEQNARGVRARSQFGGKKEWLFYRRTTNRSFEAKQYKAE